MSTTTPAGTDAAAPARRRRQESPVNPPGPPQSRALLLLERFGLGLVFIVLVVGFTLLRPETFPTLENAQTILLGQSVIAAGAFAVVIPLTGGRFDISIGANLGLCSIAAAALMSKASLPLGLAIVAALGVGALVGFFNGFIVAYLGVSSIIATLGSATIIGGLVQLYTKGVPISSGISTKLTDLGGKTILDIPSLFWIALLLAALVWYLLTQSTYGRRLAAVGVNPTAANLVGISVRRTLLLSFVGAGLLAGAGGIISVGLQGTASPETGGISFMLPVLAAAFLGATTFTPGTYNIPGTLLGLLFAGVAISGLSLLGVEPWVQQVFNGSTVIIAVALSQFFRRQRTGATDVGA